MQLFILNQMYGSNDFASRLKSSLSRARGWRFRVLVAFAKKNGLELLEPELTQFLRNNGKMHWIVGVDCGGTSPEALEYLYGLSKAYPNQVDTKIFSAGSRFHTFHPKLYLLDSRDKLAAWLGSSNMTAGGMFLNCECMTEFKISKRTDAREARLLNGVWDSYASASDYLRKLTPQVISKIGNLNGPEQPTETWEAPPHPFHKKSPTNLPKLPRSPRLTRVFRPASQPPLPLQGNDLLMEILEETRDTQVQIPVDVLENYFGIRQGERARIALCYKEKGQIKSVKYRSVVYPTSHVRIEMETISGLKRPLIAVFHRDSEREDTYDYELLKKGTNAYRNTKKLLLQKGRRTSRTSRWYLIV
jgi:HKD family nuclease